jgi:nitroreductase
MEISNFRQAQYAINDLFLNRWSPRAMSGEEIDETVLFTLLEAGRWAPSSNNNQPWRFIYARRNSPHWPVFFNLLTESNQIWAKNAAVLIVVASKTTFDSNEKFSRTHTFDTGAAWENLALEGSILGLVVHGMQGFDYDQAKIVLRIPDIYQVEAMIAIGKKGKKEDLPVHLQEREFPSPRKSIAEIAMEGTFKG